MLKIKLSPTGKKHQRHYRIVVMEEHSKLTGKNTQVVGHYHPHTKELVIDKTKYQGWISKGAQPTETVAKLWNRS